MAICFSTEAGLECALCQHSQYIGHHVFGLHDTPIFLNPMQISRSTAKHILWYLFGANGLRTLADYDWKEERGCTRFLFGLSVYSPAELAEAFDTADLRADIL